ncbi:MAG TPA: HDIG domain-containing protein [Ignavibacteria bacterium]|nr:HDIG domain-containing protein [Ignavibacteria bacterium]
MRELSSSEKLLHNYIKNDNLRKHCYAVESALRFYARKLGKDEESWEDAGLLHDLDWEMYPDTHPNTAVPILEEAGYSREIIDAILGHAYPDRTDVPRESEMAKYLFACDEITGFITAYSYMKPGGLNEVEVKGIKKKMKDKAFAKNVNRDDIIKGASEIGIELDEHINNVINAMKNDSRLNSSN